MTTGRSGFSAPELARFWGEDGLSTWTPPEGGLADVFGQAGLPACLQPEGEDHGWRLEVGLAAMREEALKRAERPWLPLAGDGEALEVGVTRDDVWAALEREDEPRLWERLARAFEELTGVRRRQLLEPYARWRAERVSEPLDPSVAWDDLALIRRLVTGRPAHLRTLLRHAWPMLTAPARRRVFAGTSR
jgi:hypothetical protein